MLTLLLPTRAHMPFRQAMLADPATMAYNAPWFPPEGCIPFPEDTWDDWLDRWTGHEPERFCGFLQEDSGKLVGEISWHGFGADIGVVILAAYRGRCYGAEGLRLLIDRAFSHPAITSLTNEFESSRTAAMAMHLRAGFTVIREMDGIATLRLERSEHA